MRAGWISESLLPWWVGPGVAVILALPAVAVGNSLYQQLDGRICNGVGDFEPDSYAYTRKLEQCIAEGKAVPGK